MQDKEEFKTDFSIKQANWCLFFVLLGFTAIDFAQTVLYIFFKIEPDINVSIYARMAALLPIVLFAFSSKKRIKSLRFWRTAPSNIVYSVFLALFVYLLSTVIVNYLAGIIVSAGGKIPDNEIMNYILSGSVLVAFLYLSVYAPFTEEIILRGIFQNAYQRRVGFYAVILTGVVFGLMHADPLASVNGVIAGLVICYIYYKTRSIWCTIAFHATFNFLGYTIIPDNYVMNLPWTLGFLPGETMDGANPAYLVYTLGIFVVSALLIYILLKHIQINNGRPPEQEDGRRLRQPFEMVPFILAGVLLALRLGLYTFTYFYS